MTSIKTEATTLQSTVEQCKAEFLTQLQATFSDLSAIHQAIIKREALYDSDKTQINNKEDIQKFLSATNTIYLQDLKLSDSEQYGHISAGGYTYNSFDRVLANLKSIGFTDPEIKKIPLSQIIILASVVTECANIKALNQARINATSEKQRYKSLQEVQEVTLPALAQEFCTMYLTKHPIQSVEIDQSTLRANMQGKYDSILCINKFQNAVFGCPKQTSDQSTSAKIKLEPFDRLQHLVIKIGTTEIKMPQANQVQDTTNQNVKENSVRTQWRQLVVNALQNQYFTNSNPPTSLEAFITCIDVTPNFTLIYNNIFTENTMTTYTDIHPSIHRADTSAILKLTYENGQFYITSTTQYVYGIQQNGQQSNNAVTIQETNVFNPGPPISVNTYKVTIIGPNATQLKELFIYPSQKNVDQFWQTNQEFIACSRFLDLFQTDVEFSQNSALQAKVTAIQRNILNDTGMSMQTRIADFHTAIQHLIMVEAYLILCEEYKTHLNNDTVKNKTTSQWQSKFQIIEKIV